MPRPIFIQPPSPEDPTATDQTIWELSGWWRRVGASLIDCAILFVPGVGIYFAMWALGWDIENYFDSWISVWDLFFWAWNIAVIIVFYGFFMPRTNGQTPGKMATGIRVVRENGLPVDQGFTQFRQTLVQYVLFGQLAILLLFIPTILNYLWPLWDDGNQALHDKIVKSRVVLAQPLDPQPS